MKRNEVINSVLRTLAKEKQKKKKICVSVSI